MLHETKKYIREYPNYPYLWSLFLNLFGIIKLWKIVTQCLYGIVFQSD